MQLERSNLFFGDEVAKTILDLVCTFRKAREVAVQLCKNIVLQSVFLIYTVSWISPPAGERS